MKIIIISIIIIYKNLPTNIMYHCHAYEVSMEHRSGLEYVHLYDRYM